MSQEEKNGIPKQLGTILVVVAVILAVVLKLSIAYTPWWVDAIIIIFGGIIWFFTDKSELPSETTKSNKHDL